MPRSRCSSGSLAAAAASLRLNAQGGREIVRSQIDRLQIAQHAGHDDSRRTGGDLVVRERDRVVGQVREPPLAALSIEKFAGVEWVDEQRLAGVIEPEHEVRRASSPLRARRQAARPG